MLPPKDSRLPRIELRYFAGCPNVEPVRRLIRECLEQLGLDVPIDEHDGDFPSPTVLVDGVDVMGAPAAPERSCRLDVPTRAQLMDALRKLGA
jgi:8-oxo-dGTP pyrophosphatase MutT (NUDIX family)